MAPRKKLPAAARVVGTPGITLNVSEALAKLIHEMALERAVTAEDLIRLGLRNLQGMKRTLGPDDAFRFGKYAEETLRVVLPIDPRYVEWMIDKGVATFNQDAMNLIEETFTGVSLSRGARELLDNVRRNDGAEVHLSNWVYLDELQKAGYVEVSGARGPRREFKRATLSLDGV